MMELNRLIYPLLGLVGGLGLYAIGELGENGLLAVREREVLTVAFAGFFAAWLALIWDLRPWRAGLSAFVLAAMIGGLLYSASFRYDSVFAFWSSGAPVELAFLLGVLPLPFVMAAGAGESGYAAAFGKAWDLFLQGAGAIIFLLLTWGAAYLAADTLALIGLDLWPWLNSEAQPYLISGLSLGAAIALIAGRTEVVPLGLLLWPLRLALLPLLALGIVFLVGYAFDGLVPGHYASTTSTTLIALALGGILSITAALGPDTRGALRSPLLLWTIGPVALVVLLLSLVALTSLWQSVLLKGASLMDFYDAVAALVTLGFGVSYLLTFLWPGEQMAHMRAANGGMLAVTGLLAALMLSPALSAEDWVAWQQKNRVLEKARIGYYYDLGPFFKLGKAGQKAALALRDAAKTEGLSKLATDADLVAQEIALGATEEREVSAALNDLLPVQPASAAAERDALIESLSGFEHDNYKSACAKKLSNGGPGCVLVIADFLPESPEPEALLLSRRPGWQLEIQAFRKYAGGWVRAQAQIMPGSHLLSEEGGEALIAQLQGQMPTLAPVPMRQLSFDNHMIFIVPTD